MSTTCWKRESSGDAMASPGNRSQVSDDVLAHIPKTLRQHRTAVGWVTIAFEAGHDSLATVHVFNCQDRLASGQADLAHSRPSSYGLCLGKDNFGTGSFI